MAACALPGELEAMPVKRSKRAPHYYEVRFWLAGREVRRSAGTHDKRAAEAYEERLRAALWRQNKLGEKHFTWDDATAQLKLEDSGARSWERTERAIAKLTRLLAGAPLTEITRENILKVRDVLARQQHRGDVVKSSSVNRVLAVLRIVLNRCVTDWRMLDAAPKVPLFRIERVEPTHVGRQQIAALLAALPEHSRDMAIVACATGMRRSEVTHMEWAHVDTARATCFVPAANAKNGHARVVPLNSDAIAVIEKWRAPRSKCNQPHARHVFYFRGRAPIRQVSTRAWRLACTSVGLEGFRFHDLRHTWASWHAEAGTPLQVLQELGGWLSFAMVQRYAHLSPGHLAQYASASLLVEKSEVPAQKPEQVDELAKRRA